MKIKVEYSESIQITEGLWRKWGIELDMDHETDSLEDNGKILSVDETTESLHNAAKTYVQRWHKEDATEQMSPHINSTFALSEAVQKNTHNSVIDRSIERLEILIDDCKTTDDLVDLIQRNPRISNVEALSSQWQKKLEELSK